MGLFLLPLTLAMAALAALVKLLTDGLTMLARILGTLLALPFRALSGLLGGARGDGRRRP